jgi:hypothetical protein
MQYSVLKCAKTYPKVELESLSLHYGGLVKVMSHQYTRQSSTGEPVVIGPNGGSND